MPDNSAVLFISSWYPTQEDPMHGIFIQNHAKALSIHTPVVVAYAYSHSSAKHISIQVKKNGNLTEIIATYPKTKIGIPGIKHYLRVRAFKHAYKEIIRTIEQQNIAIKAIQVNVVFPVSLVLNMFLQHFNVPYTISEHWSGYLPEDGNYKGYIQKQFTEACFRKAQKVWVVSEKQKQAMITHGLKNNFELLYNAIDTNTFKITHTPRFDTFTLIHVSSLVEREKNLKGTFQVLKLLQDKHLKFNVLIIGGNAENIAAAKDIQSQTGVVNIEYKGYQPKEVISDLMNKSHALILLSHFEGMPVVTLEALACGLPVFASTVGHLPHLISNEFGRLTAASNIHEMAKYIQSYMNGELHFDREKMNEFVVKQASFEAVGKQLNDFYKKI